MSNKAFLTFETLLVWLNDKIATTAGVKYIFTLPEGNEVREVNQFIGGRSYVVSSVRKIMHVPYGDAKERFWPNRCVDVYALRTQLIALSVDINPLKCSGVRQLHVKVFNAIRV